MNNVPRGKLQQTKERLAHFSFMRLKQKHNSFLIKTFKSKEFFSFEGEVDCILVLMLCLLSKKRLYYDKLTFFSNKPNS
jgi:hypothetical protein